jgi:formylglycine-generating enzyme required for sulfatase activity
MLVKSNLNPPVDTASDGLLTPRVPEMITIPAGTCWMGTSEEQMKMLLEKEDWADEWYQSDLFQVEMPAHQVNVREFELARYPVTNIEYHVFVYNASHKVPKHWIGFKYLDGTDDHPVTNVSRHDVDAYIRWLNQQVHSVYRLPTEVEWEKAARGTDLRTYPWGDGFDPWRCNTVESGKKQTTPVGEYSPGGDGPYGNSDIVGNVWEWTSSLMKPYPLRIEDMREASPLPGNKLVVRGGAWYYSRALARCSSREGVLPDFMSASLGFRLARSR